MNVLLLTTVSRKSQKMLKDIVNRFIRDGHNLYVVCPSSDVDCPKSSFVFEENVNYLYIKNNNSTGRVNLIKKVKNFLLVDYYYKRALRKATKELYFDLILYTTPPITLVNTIRWAKQTFNANTYLMLKDIFPQNAVDIGMMKKNGIMGLVWRYFRKKEKKLYECSDFIGCMSPANCRYILKHNAEIPRNRVGLCVNSYEEKPLLSVDKDFVREKYGIPKDKIIFIYGGNLGKPQGLNFLVKILEENQNKEDRFFLICGDGKEQHIVLNFIEKYNPDNVKYMPSIPPDNFDELSLACDVGMVFLDYRFTIPNFPSRMLSIMLNQMPILAATDRNTDVGEVIESGNIGWWCESTDTTPFNSFIDEICANPDTISIKGKNAREYYLKNYTTEITYSQILEGIEKINES